MADPVTQFLADRYSETLQGLSGPFQPLVHLIGYTPLELTTMNDTVLGAWRLMTGVADAFLGLFVVITLIQVMYGEHTGTVHIPLGQFVAKTILTAIMIHFSFLIGQDLLIFCNLICSVIRANYVQFLRMANLQGNSQLLFQTLLQFAMLISFIRVLFQAVKRVIRFNLAFVLGGPAFLTALHPYTAPIFSAWARILVLTIFEQLVQFLAMSLSIQFLVQIGQNAGVITDMLLAIAALTFVAEIPNLLARFGAGVQGSGGGFGTVVRLAMTAGMVLAA